MPGSIYCGTLVAVLGCAIQAQERGEPVQKTLLLTGCLERGTERSVFRLSEATLHTPASSVPADPVHRQDRPGRSVQEFELATATSVDRTGTQPADLDLFVGWRVEVTARPPESAAASPPSSPPAATGGPKADPKKPVRLTVTAVRRLSRSCQ